MLEMVAVGGNVLQASSLKLIMREDEKRREIVLSRLMIRALTPNSLKSGSWFL